MEVVIVEVVVGGCGEGGVVGGGEGGVVPRLTRSGVNKKAGTSP